MTGEDELAELTESARELVAKVNSLNESTGDTIEHLADRSVRNRRWIQILIVSLILDLILTIAMGIGGYFLHNNDRRIDLITKQLNNEQKIQREKALCPLYQIFLNSEHNIPPNQTPEQLATRAEAFKTIHASYDALSCKDLLQHR